MKYFLVAINRCLPAPTWIVPILHHPQQYPSSHIDSRQYLRRWIWVCHQRPVTRCETVWECNLWTAVMDVHPPPWNLPPFRTALHGANDHSGSVWSAHIKDWPNNHDRISARLFMFCHCTTAACWPGKAIYISSTPQSGSGARICHIRNNGSEPKNLSFLDLSTCLAPAFCWLFLHMFDCDAFHLSYPFFTFTGWN